MCAGARNLRHSSTDLMLDVCVPRWRRRFVLLTTFLTRILSLSWLADIRGDNMYLAMRSVKRSFASVSYNRTVTHRDVGAVIPSGHENMMQKL
jgi:hypothetical protein